MLPPWGVAFVRQARARNDNRPREQGAGERTGGKMERHAHDILREELQGQRPGSRKAGRHFRLRKALPPAAADAKEKRAEHG